MPLISVIVPVYKVEKYLERCVDSILCQSLADFELWLVDDGSPDACPAICDSYAGKDGRVKVIHKENGGLSSARNAALDRAAGKYICFVDSDDYITPDALETLYTAITETGADIATGNMMSVDENGDIKDFYTPAKERKVLEGEEILSTMNQPCACNRLYRAGIFRNVRFPEGRLYEDVFVYHKILSQTKRMVFTGKTDYYYLIRQDSIMHSEYNIRFTDIVFAIKERYEWLDSIGQKALANEARLFVYSRVAAAYANLDASVPENREKLREIKDIYISCYRILMNDRSLGVKQKIRLFLLRYLPAVHTKFFGKEMPLALG
ncbi:MAG: glycosyltransferase family 2 protein [Clostridia bacterium]|nr:glycosyltransferase family 2 protein [Clostridia bacterium]